MCTMWKLEIVKLSNIHSIIEITMNIDITETKAEQMLYALTLAKHRAWKSSMQIDMLKHTIEIQEKLNR